MRCYVVVLVCEGQKELQYSYTSLVSFWLQQLQAGSESHRDDDAGLADETNQNAYWFGLLFKTNILPVPLSGQSRPVHQLSLNLQEPKTDK